MQLKTLVLIVKKPSAALSLALSLFASCAVGFAVFLYLQGIKNAVVASTHNALLSQANQRFNARVGDIEQSTRLLSKHLKYILSFNSDALPQEIMAQFGLAVPTVSQIRWINSAGDETFRVNYKDGKASIVPSELLQNKSDRYFVKDALSSTPNDVTLSDVDLNVEFGKVEVPYVPTIRGIINFEEHVLGQGLFVVNYQLVDLISNLRAMTSQDHQLLIAESNGNWVLHPNKSLEWGEELKSGFSSDKTLPRIWRTIEGESSVSLIRSEDGDVYSAVRISHSLKSDFDEESLVFFVRTSKRIYERLYFSSLVPSICLSVLIACLSIFFLLQDKFREMTLSLLATRLEEEKALLAQALDEQQLLQDELIEAEKMASLGILVSGVAHELNTPIGGALMTISSLRRRVDELEEALPDKLTLEKLHAFIKHNREASELAVSNLTRSADLIKRFKRVSTDRGSEDITEFSLEKLITDLAHSLMPILKKKKVVLAIDSPCDITMKTYPGVLSQTLQNLIVNSVEHAFDVHSNNEIVISIRRVTDKVIIKHKDNGKGVSDDVKHKLFDPFVTTARAAGNSGLGLHLVHQWVTNVLGGKVKVNSKAGETVFTLTLPIEQQANDDNSELN